MDQLMFTLNERYRSAEEPPPSPRRNSMEHDTVPPLRSNADSRAGWSPPRNASRRIAASTRPKLNQQTASSSSGYGNLRKAPPKPSGGAKIYTYKSPFIQDAERRAALRAQQALVQMRKKKKQQANEWDNNVYTEPLFDSKLKKQEIFKLEPRKPPELNYSKQQQSKGTASAAAATSRHQHDGDSTASTIDDSRLMNNSTLSRSPNNRGANGGVTMKTYNVSPTRVPRRFAGKENNNHVRNATSAEAVDTDAVGDENSSVNEADTSFLKEPFFDPNKHQLPHSRKHQQPQQEHRHASSPPVRPYSPPRHPHSPPAGHTRPTSNQVQQYHPHSDKDNPQHQQPVGVIPYHKLLHKKLREILQRKGVLPADGAGPAEGGDAAAEQHAVDREGGENRPIRSVPAAAPSGSVASKTAEETLVGNIADLMGAVGNIIAKSASASAASGGWRGSDIRHQKKMKKSSRSPFTHSSGGNMINTVGHRTPIPDEWLRAAGDGVTEADILRAASKGQPLPAPLHQTPLHPGGANSSCAAYPSGDPFWPPSAPRAPYDLSYLHLPRERHSLRNNSSNNSNSNYNNNARESKKDRQVVTGTLSDMMADHLLSNFAVAPTTAFATFEEFEGLPTSTSEVLDTILEKLQSIEGTEKEMRDFLSQKLRGGGGGSNHSSRGGVVGMYNSNNSVAASNATSLPFASSPAGRAVAAASISHSSVGNHTSGAGSRGDSSVARGDEGDACNDDDGFVAKQGVSQVSHVTDLPSRGAVHSTGEGLLEYNSTDNGGNTRGGDKNEDSAPPFVTETDPIMTYNQPAAYGPGRGGEEGSQQPQSLNKKRQQHSIFSASGGGGSPSILHTHDNAVSNWMHRMSNAKAAPSHFGAMVESEGGGGGGRGGAGGGKCEAVHLALIDEHHPNGEHRLDISPAMPPSSADLHLLALLGVNTHVSRAQARNEFRTAQQREKEILYMKQFPTVGKPSENWGKTAEIYDFMKKMDAARKLKDVAFNARGVSCAEVCDTVSQEIYSQYVEGVCADVEQLFDEFSEQFVEQV